MDRRLIGPDVADSPADHPRHRRVVCESSLLTLLLIGGLAAYGCLTAVQAKPHRAAANTLPM